MRDDEAIEKVLGALRATASPAGMERRAVNALLERLGADGVKTARSWSMGLLSSFSGGRAFGLRGGDLAAAGVIAVLTVVFAVARSQHRPGLGPTDAAKAEVSMQVRAPQPSPNSGRGDDRALPAQSDHRTLPRRATREMTGVSLRVRAATITSYPAPVAPLSAEERMLLQVARTGGPEEIAMLDPVARAKEEAEGEAEFERFAGQSRHE